MSNDFDRAVNFLQGALDVAMFEATKKPEPQVEPEPPFINERQLELPLDHEPEPTAKPTPVPFDESIPPKEPLLTEKGPVPTTVPLPKPGLTIGWFAALLAASVCTALTVVIACKAISPRVITETVPVEPDGIPFALLPQSADASLWDIVSTMHGTINGEELTFNHGRTEDGTYKLALDFCRSGNDIYAKVIGNGLWVVKLAPDGTILKAYPTRPTAKPLKDIFTR